MRNAPQASPTSKMPVYLARASYRQRRLRDVMRVLPFVGFLAWIMPTMAGILPASSTVGLYIFAVWMILIASSALINRRLIRQADDSLVDTSSTA